MKMALTTSLHSYIKSGRSLASSLYSSFFHLRGRCIEDFLRVGAGAAATLA